MKALPISLILAAIAITLTGCEQEPADSCAQWVPYDSPQEKYDAADAVFVASHSEASGTTRIYAVDASTYTVEVDEVLKGNIPADTIRITSMPITCTQGNQYPEGDPLDTAERTIVFVRELDGAWFTLTPRDGTLPYSTDTLEEMNR